MPILNEYRPWEETGQTPIAWMLEHCEKYAISKEKILESAIDVNSDLEGIPNCCCVYFFIEGGEIVYAGKANGLYWRMLGHLRKLARGETPAFKLSWISGMPELFVEDVENYYIHWLQPTKNVKYSRPSDVTEKLLNLQPNL